MQIQLKQPEIVSALKQFISSQGISLLGKNVDISFTAGRKEAGLSADISIEDAEIPGVHLGETESTKPTLSVVKAEPYFDPAVDERLKSHSEADAAAILAGTAAEPAAPAAKTTSLFS